MKKLLIIALPCLLFFVNCKKENKEPIDTPPAPKLKTDSTKLNLSGDVGSLDSFTIQSNGSWAISINPTTTTWLSPNVMNGTGNAKVYITAQENNITGSDRAATLVITLGGTTTTPVQITVTQKKYNPDINRIWSKLFGGSNHDYFDEVIQTPDGGFISVGSSSSVNGDIGAHIGEHDIWVVKVDADGNKLWEKSYGGLYWESGPTITETTDGNYVIAANTRSTTGDFSGNKGENDLYVFKIDASGTLLWQKLFGGSNAEGTPNFDGKFITSSPDGGCVIAATTGSNDGDVIGNHGYQDIWVIKLNQNGTLVWKTALGGSSEEVANAITSAADGGYVIAGYTTSSDGDISNNQHPSTYEAWVIKINADGQKVWQSTFGGSDQDYAVSITTTPNNGYIIAGYTNSKNDDASGNLGRSDAWVLKLDGSGNKLWHKTYGGMDTEYAFSIARTDIGYLITGHTSSSNGDVILNPYGVSGWVFEIEENGNIKWQKVFPGIAYNVISQTDGSYVASGISAMPQEGSSTNHGETDAWIFKFNTE
jgi:hypothetical protein